MVSLDDDAHLVLTMETTVLVTKMLQVFLGMSFVAGVSGSNCWGGSCGSGDGDGLFDPEDLDCGLASCSQLSGEESFTLGAG